MPKRYLVFENLSPYPIINRGVDKRAIFQEENDYYRFIFQAYSANFGSPGRNLGKDKIIQAAKALLKGDEITEGLIQKEHPPLVYILNFSLMPDHIHFTLAQRADQGITKFMQKLTCAFACYFNAKYERSGTLFQGRFKAISIKNKFHLDVVTRYINVNSLDIFQKDWKEKGLENCQEATEFLKKYQWSSYPDFIGIRHSHFLSPREILRMFYGEFTSESEQKYQEFIKEYLPEHWREFTPLFLEK